MAWDDREKNELILDEGRFLKSYKDQFGNWTIGVGHFLGPNSIYADLVWTDEQVDSTFEDDFKDAEAEAQSAYKEFLGLDGPRKGALVNMSFQLGYGKFSRFLNFFNYLDQGLYKEAAIDLMNTAYARQVPARAQRIAYRIRTGEYTTR